MTDFTYLYLGFGAGIAAILAVIYYFGFYQPKAKSDGHSVKYGATAFDKPFLVFAGKEGASWSGFAGKREVNSDGTANISIINGPELKRVDESNFEPMSSPLSFYLGINPIVACNVDANNIARRGRTDLYKVYSPITLERMRQEAKTELLGNLKLVKSLERYTTKVIRKPTTKKRTTPTGAYVPSEDSGEDGYE